MTAFPYMGDALDIRRAFAEELGKRFRERLKGIDFDPKPTIQRLVARDLAVLQLWARSESKDRHLDVWDRLPAEDNTKWQEFIPQQVKARHDLAIMARRVLRYRTLSEHLIELKRDVAANLEKLFTVLVMPVSGSYAGRPVLHLACPDPQWPEIADLFPNTDYEGFRAFHTYTQRQLEAEPCNPHREDLGGGIRSLNNVVYNDLKSLSSVEDHPAALLLGCRSGLQWQVLDEQNQVIGMVALYVPLYDFWAHLDITSSKLASLVTGRKAAERNRRYKQAWSAPHPEDAPPIKQLLHCAISAVNREGVREHLCRDLGFAINYSERAQSTVRQVIGMSSRHEFPRKADAFRFLIRRCTDLCAGASPSGGADWKCADVRTYLDALCSSLSDLDAALNWGTTHDEEIITEPDITELIDVAARTAATDRKTHDRVGWRAGLPRAAKLVELQRGFREICDHQIALRAPGVRVRGGPLKLMIVNLLTNAFTYYDRRVAHEVAPVQFRCTRAGKWLDISIGNVAKQNNAEQVADKIRNTWVGIPDVSAAQQGLDLAWACAYYLAPEPGGFVTTRSLGADRSFLTIRFRIPVLEVGR